jgi:hypothetical protein
MKQQRIRINLTQRLSPAARWSLAASVVAAVSIIAWALGRDRPIPAWISDGLVPALGWIYLALLCVAAVHLLRRRRSRTDETGEPKA